MVYQFFDCYEGHGVKLHNIQPVRVAAYVEKHSGTTPTVKQQLAAILMLFDYLVTGRVLPMNPAGSIRGPKHMVKRGKTLVLSAN